MSQFCIIPEIGKLTEEKVLFEFDKIPIIFVCKNQYRQRYLCICTDCILGYSWMITEVSRDILIDLIRDKITVLEAFGLSKKKVYIIEKDKEQYLWESYDFSDVPKDELPDENEKLENPFLIEYLTQLELEESVRGARSKLNEMLKDFITNSEAKTVNAEISILKDRHCVNNKYLEVIDAGVSETLKLPYTCVNSKEKYIKNGKYTGCKLLI